MSITILCTGAPEHAIGGKYSSVGFDAAVQAERNSNIVPYGGRKHDPAGRTVLIGEDPLARRTAEQLILPAALRAGYGAAAERDYCPLLCRHRQGVPGGNLAEEGRFTAQARRPAAAGIPGGGHRKSRPAD